MKTPPDVIWLQFHGDEEPDYESEHAGITWCSDQIFDHDVRYVIDKRYKKREVKPKRGR